MWFWISEVEVFLFVQAEDGIRDLVRSRGLGDVYKRQREQHAAMEAQQHRRFLKTHLAVDGLPIYAQVKYLSLIHI